MPANQKLPITNPEIKKSVATALQQIRHIAGFEHVRFIILYGSAGKRTMNSESDIDLCIYYEGDRNEAAQFRYAALSRLPGIRYDIQIFQLLPLYVRIEVLKGTPVFLKNPVFLYETATRTLREFEDYKHRLYDYTGQVAIS